MTAKNGLKIFLGAIYLVLIALLLMQGCDNEASAADDRPIDEQEAIEAAEEIGGDGEIKITLLWNFYGDVDLHVTQPNGVELSFREMRDRRTGGRLDVDNREGGRGSAENVYWTRPLKGKYRVNVEMYRISPQSRRGGEARVVVKNGGETSTYTVRLTFEGQNVLVTEFFYDPDAVRATTPADSVAV